MAHGCAGGSSGRGERDLTQAALLARPLAGFKELPEAQGEADRKVEAEEAAADA